MTAIPNPSIVIGNKEFIFAVEISENPKKLKIKN